MALEQRCTDLDAACICAEQLNTATMTEVQANSFWDPDDSTTKECTMAPGSHDGAWFEYDHFSLQVATSGVMFTALPNLDASIEYLWRAQDGDSGNFQGHVFGAGTPTGRRSLRWYQYFSSAWEPSDGGSPSCLNSGKLWEMTNAGGSGNVILVSTSAEGSHGIYGWDGGNPPSSYGWNISPFDCCSTGPGPALFAYDAATMNGKWWRFEVAIDNVLTTGDTTVVRTWRKNVTDDEPEELVLDTSETVASGPDDWTSTQATTLKPLATINTIMNVPWRNGTCAGYTGHTHYLAAAWSTADGQRIGAAEEIEGAQGGGGGAERRGSLGGLV